MGKNLIPEIAKMLGLELGEEFKIIGIESTYRFTEKNLETFCKDDFGEDCFWGHCSEFVLADLIKGRNEVIKLPWHPQYGDNYWSYGEDTFLIVKDTWAGTARNYAMLKCGMVFCTKEEALENRPRIYKELTGEDWEITFRKKRTDRGGK